MKAAVVLVCLVCLVAAGADAAATYTPPFSRLLTLQQPPLTGADVNVTQHLLVRDPSVGAGGLKMTGQYDAATQAAVMSFQKGALFTAVRCCPRRWCACSPPTPSVSLS